MPLIALFKKNGSSGFGYGSTSDEVVEGLDLSGKTMLVTGVRSGLGRQTVASLTARGASVLSVARKKEEAAEALAGKPGAAFACDLCEPASVRACVAEVKKHGKKIDALICNAGVMAIANLQTKHGLEMQFLTNHIGHYLLVMGLLDQLTEKGRVVMLS